MWIDLDRASKGSPIARHLAHSYDGSMWPQADHKARAGSLQQQTIANPAPVSALHL
jgi:hypothetical protein